ncbi:MAG: hypothetical protein WBP45_02800, partial [Daejeonella sp.]
MADHAKPIILFCQAPSDLPLILTVYEKFNRITNLSIYVVNVENNYKFIKGLNLDLKSLLFIPYKNPTLKDFRTIIAERKRIKALNDRYFNHVTNHDVYFFSRYEDWITSAFIKTLSLQNKIFYINTYDDISGDFSNRQKLNLRRFVLRSVFWFLTTIKFKMEIVEKLPEFYFQKYHIEESTLSVNPIVYEKYC